MNDPLTILAPTRYPWRFNGPRRSRHRIENRSFLPFNKLDPRYEGVTIFNPWPPRHFDLIHAFNRVPIGSTPYVIGFESHLPRAFWFETSRFYRALVHSLASDRCRAIVATSQHAADIFLETHAASALAETLQQKLRRRFPSVAAGPLADPMVDDPLDEIRLVFVGSHFGRKGGCVAVRMAQLGAQQGLPIHVDVVSDLVCGPGVWTDPERPGFFDPYIDALQSSRNITWRRQVPNEEALTLMRQAHFTLLPTFGDTFGYSAVESMANHTPVIATRQGALPEFINDGENGILLELPTNSRGEWIYSSANFRGEPRFEAIFSDEVDRMATEALARVARITADAKSYRDMRRQARQTAEMSFSDRDASAYWDDLYSEQFRRSGSTS